MSFIKTASSHFFQLQSELGFEGHTSTLATYSNHFFSRGRILNLCALEDGSDDCVFLIK